MVFEDLWVLCEQQTEDLALAMVLISPNLTLRVEDPVENPGCWHSEDHTNDI